MYRCIRAKVFWRKHIVGLLPLSASRDASAHTIATTEAASVVPEKNAGDDHGYR